MPMAASRSAAAAKIVSSDILKLARAVESATTSSMVVISASGKPPEAWRNSFSMALANVRGATRVRTIHAIGPMR